MKRFVPKQVQYRFCFPLGCLTIARIRPALRAKLCPEFKVNSDRLVAAKKQIVSTFRLRLTEPAVIAAQTKSNENYRADIRLAREQRANVPARIAYVKRLSALTKLTYRSRAKAALRVTAAYCLRQHTRAKFNRLSMVEIKHERKSVRRKNQPAVVAKQLVVVHKQLAIRKQRVAPDKKRLRRKNGASA